MKKSNYTSVCWYCGDIFESIRSTAKFCGGGSHRSLHYENGPAINPFLVDSFGHVVNISDIFSDILDFTEGMSEEGWSPFVDLDTLRNKANYHGPVPKGYEILVLADYVMIAAFDKPFSEDPVYAVKPIQDITRFEKATGVFVKPR